MTKVLYIGGSGEISSACIDASLAAGHTVSSLNRGQSSARASGIEAIRGDIRDPEPYQNLGQREFDVVCQFIAYSPEEIARDIAYFKHRCEQYIFISSASVYQKPPTHRVITELTPRENPYWLYAQQKIACESRLEAQTELPYTIVRPSHTYRTRLPGTVISGDHQTWRLLNNKPIIVHGDGQSLWTLTYASDFANAFVRLFQNPKAFNDDFHITSDTPDTWDRILLESAKLLAVEPEFVHIASQALAQSHSNWLGPLLGDKSNSVVFDNAKLRGAIGPWQCEITLEQGLEQAWAFTKSRLENFSPEPEAENLVDQIIRRHFPT